MLWSLERLRDYTLRATDGEVGSVRDVLVDEVGWRVRYLVVATGSWLFGRRVVLGTEVLAAPTGDARTIPVALTRDRIEAAPAADDAPSFGRRFEERLRGHYGWPAYWGAGMADVVAVPAALPDAVTAADEAADGPALHSVRDVEGFAIAARDGEIGTVADALIDDGWRLRYWIVDTGKWLPGRRVALAADWIRGVDWIGRALDVDVERAKVEGSPGVLVDEGLTRADEAAIHDWYGRAPYW
jgi:hypothetical protein